MDIPEEKVLFRKYLSKLNQDTRTRVCSKDWRIDGPEEPPRPAKTYKELQIAIGLMLEERNDLRAIDTLRQDSVYNVEEPPAPHPQGRLTPKAKKETRNVAGGGPTVACQYCQMPNNHPHQICPQKYCDDQGERAHWEKLHRTKGTKCNLCGSTSHADHHHHKAVTAYGDRRVAVAPPAPANEKGKGEKAKGSPKSEAKGKGKDAGKNQKGDDKKKYFCRFKDKCRNILEFGKCDYWHEPEELKRMLKQRKEAQAANAEGGKKGNRKPKGKGKGKKTEEGEGKPPENISQVEEANAAPKETPAPRITPKPKKERVQAIQEEVHSLAEEIGGLTHAADRVEKTVELGDYFSCQGQSTD